MHLDAMGAGEPRPKCTYTRKCQRPSAFYWVVYPGGLKGGASSDKCMLKQRTKRVCAVCAELIRLANYGS